MLCRLEEEYTRFLKKKKEKNKTKKIIASKNVLVGINCNYILFTKLRWLGDSEETFYSSSQAAICPAPALYTTLGRGFTLSL